MLKALESGKLRGLVISTVEDLRERQLLLEDLLTATVFGRLQYLPDAQIQALVHKLLEPTEHAASSIGSLTEISFWPRYRHVLENKNVEPDVVLEFESLIVVIEAKRRDGIAMHSQEQLKGERDALTAELSRDPETVRKEVVIFALGGHRDDAKVGDELPGVVALSWRRLWRSITQLDLQDGGLMRLRNDIGTALLLAGIRTKERVYFNSLRPASYRSSSTSIGRLFERRPQSMSLRTLLPAGLGVPRLPER